MSTVVSISKDDKRLEEASRWVLKMDEGSLSAEDTALFREWLNQDLKHRDVLLEVAVVWDKADSLSRLADFFPHEVTESKQTDRRRQKNWVFGSLVAAGLFVLALVTVVNLPGTELRSESPLGVMMQAAAYETTIGEQKTILLPDGTEVVLNTNSRLSLSYTATARVLHLDRGEIHVRVAKEARPLSVVAVDQIVQAKGTEFTVEITEEQHVEVLVTEGRVVVGIQPKAARRADVPAAQRSALTEPPVLAQLADNTLSAGEEAVLGENETVKKQVSIDEIEVRLSWKKSRLIFRSEPLETALREVERYTTVEFVMLDERLKSKTLTGRFRTGDVEALLASLQLHFNIQHKFDGENRVLLSSF